MTQEEKELLIRDLCARLPYGVIVRHSVPLIDNYGNKTGEFWHKRGYLCNITTLDDITTTIIESEGSDEEGYKHIWFLDMTVPYLRPMSSMTEEEEIAYFNLEGAANIVDWLNKYHFDYRGLIPMELAIEITKDNNPYKNK